MTADQLASSPWALGARTVSQAVKDTGLSRQQLFALMGDGTLRWTVKDERNTRLIAWADLVAYLERLDQRHNTEGTT